MLDNLDRLLDYTGPYDTCQCYRLVLPPHRAAHVRPEDSPRRAAGCGRGSRGGLPDLGGGGGRAGGNIVYPCGEGAGEGQRGAMLEPVISVTVSYILEIAWNTANAGGG